MNVPWKLSETTFTTLKLPSKQAKNFQIVTDYMPPREGGSESCVKRLRTLGLTSHQVGMPFHPFAYSIPPDIGRAAMERMPNAQGAARRMSGGYVSEEGQVFAYDIAVDLPRSGAIHAIGRLLSNPREFIAERSTATVTSCITPVEFILEAAMFEPDQDSNA